MLSVLGTQNKRVNGSKETRKVVNLGDLRRWRVMVNALLDSCVWRAVCYAITVFCCDILVVEGKRNKV